MLQKCDADKVRHESAQEVWTSNKKDSILSTLGIHVESVKYTV